LLVTGMSGAGKSTVLDALEDMGWDIVDNLPVDLLEPFVRGEGTCRLAPAAVAMDVRSRGFDAESLPTRIRSIEGVEPEILYLECAEGENFGRHSGLGLAIAQAIVNGHDGEIDVQDRNDAPSGARFTIRLPAADRE
jgi:hypothetical protein